MNCPNIYCPCRNEKENCNQVFNKDCKMREKYIQDNCPTEEEYNNTLRNPDEKIP